MHTHWAFAVLHATVVLFRWWPTHLAWLTIIGCLGIDRTKLRQRFICFGRRLVVNKLSDQRRQSFGAEPFQPHAERLSHPHWITYPSSSTLITYPSSSTLITYPSSLITYPSSSTAHPHIVYQHLYPRLSALSRYPLWAPSNC